MADSLAKCLEVLCILETNRRYENLNPSVSRSSGSEIYNKAIGGQMDAKSFQLATLWVLNLSDGEHSPLDIAERSGSSFDVIRSAADALRYRDLLRERLS